jgi:hypothetical protein
VVDRLQVGRMRFVANWAGAVKVTVSMEYAFANGRWEIEGRQR